MFQAQRPWSWLEIYLFFAAKKAEGPLSLQSDAVLINAVWDQFWVSMHFVWVGSYCFTWKEVLRAFLEWI